MTLRLGACAAAVLVASGCASSPLKQFPEFPARYDGATRTHLIADVAVLDDVRGRRDQLTVGTNRELAQTLTDSLATWMGARGYVVDQTYPGAVGLLVSPRAVVRLRADAATDAVLDSAATAPYYVDDAVSADPLWGAVLGTWGLGTEGPAPARTSQPEAFVVLTARGRRVPLGKSVLQGVLTGVATGVVTGGAASLSVFETSGAVVQLAVVDGATGDVLWRDTRQVQYDASDKAVLGLVRQLVRRLPARPSARA